MRRLIDLGSKRDSHHATRTALLTSAGSKYLETNALTSTSESHPVPFDAIVPLDVSASAASALSDCAAPRLSGGE